MAEMQIPKPTDASRALFNSLVPQDGRVEVKPMFGNVGAFVNGNMFMGIFGADVGLKLPEADLDALRAAGGQPFGPAGRPMGGYVALPSTFSEQAAQPWVGKSLEYVGGLPPKAPKAKPTKRR
jgi:TfoX/Sxy family transcriptional regulator of competence genes